MILGLVYIYQIINIQNYDSVLLIMQLYYQIKIWRGYFIEANFLGFELRNCLILSNTKKRKISFKITFEVRYYL